MGCLELEGKTIVVFGAANRKSVGFAAGEVLLKEGAQVVWVVRSPERERGLRKLLPEGAEIHRCDVERSEEIAALTSEIGRRHPKIHGLVHSIAFANYSGGKRPFHEVGRTDFLQAMQVSCHSLIEISGAFRELLDPNASVVTVSISTTTMAAENYGYMAPVKAALDASVVFLAKSFSAFSNVRFNAVAPGLLKTSASAGIPGYVDSYLFGELATLRKRGVKTSEVADTIAFLLSARSSGINAQRLVIDAGMGVNYFDQEIVSRATRSGLEVSGEK